VQDGSFAKKWIRENELGRPEFNRIKEEQRNHLIERARADLRKMTKWIEAK
jgi:ketol-acid reductoisomerase